MCFPIKSQPIKSFSVQCTSSSKRPTYSDATITIRVPTFVKKNEKQMDTKNLTSSDLASLRAKDPFMYYSIPAARNAAMCGNDINPSEIDSSKTGTSQNVTRQHRVSTECHPMMLLDEVFEDETTPSSENDALDEYLDALFEEMRSKAKRLRRN